MNPMFIFAAASLIITGLWGFIGHDRQSQIIEAVTGHPIGRYSLISSPTISPTPTIAIPVKSGSSSPKIGSSNAYAIDVDSATILFQQKAAEHHSIASITKLATILTILDRHDLAEVVTVPSLPGYPGDAVLAGLEPGQQWTLRDIVKLALIPSANDAADALAIYDAGSASAFTDRVNAKIAGYGITDTHFASASGLSEENNYASAEALAKIALVALHQPFIRQTVGESSVTVTSKSGVTVTKQSTDQLLATGRFYGIKTGYTLAAGQCFVGLTKISGHEVVIVVLGSGDRFGETSAIADWIGQNYKWY